MGIEKRGFGEREMSHPVERAVGALQQRSKFTRQEKGTPDTSIQSPEGKTFALDVAKTGEDPVLTDVQSLLERTFGADEVDPEEIMRAAVEDEPSYRIVTVKNEAREVVAAVMGAVLDMETDDGVAAKDGVYFVGYAVVDASARQGGLAREGYISAILDAAEQAKKRGKELKFTIGECTESSEQFWNSVGWKRIYARSKDGSTFTELPYIQPALDFDTETGDFAEDAGEVPEHLMMGSFGDKMPTKEEIKRAYRAMIGYVQVDWEARDVFESDEAHAKVQKYFADLMEKFEAFLDDSDELLYATKEERDEQRERGVTIEDHPELQAEQEEEI